MVTVSFITFCHPPHLPKLHREGVLLDILQSHAYPFNEVIVVHQRCRGIPYREIAEVEHRVVESEEWEGENKDYAPILSHYDIPADDPVMDELTHGPEAAHYWKWHCINHLIGLLVAKGEYIVFADCDTKIIHSHPRRSWVEQGMGILNQRRDIFCVAPSDGGGERMTPNMSQQCFLVESARMHKGPLNLPWNGKFDAPGGPMQEYYGMLEGRIGRLMTTFGLYRYVLPDTWRYWHYNPWVPKEWDNGDQH